MAKRDSGGRCILAFGRLRADQWASGRPGTISVYRKKPAKRPEYDSRTKISYMPKLAVFPKAFMHALCRDGTMKLADWIDLAVQLDVDGLEWYAGFIEMSDERNWPHFRSIVESFGKSIPMMCCSPDFTHPSDAFRKKEIDKQKNWIDMTFALGG